MVTQCLVRTNSLFMVACLSCTLLTDTLLCLTKYQRESLPESDEFTVIEWTTKGQKIYQNNINRFKCGGQRWCTLSEGCITKQLFNIVLIYKYIVEHMSLQQVLVCGKLKFFFVFWLIFLCEMEKYRRQMCLCPQFSMHVSTVQYVSVSTVQYVTVSTVQYVTVYGSVCVCVHSSAFEAAGRPVCVTVVSFPASQLRTSSHIFL
jgi:hypothetical protein